MPAGRPSDYSEELAERICERIALGESLRKMCDEEGMPDHVTVIRWLAKHREFATKYARARELQADVMDELILDTAKACTEDNSQSARVKIGAFQWRASKLRPKVYGDRQSIEMDVKHSFAELSDDELNAEIARLAAQAGTV